MEIMKLKYGKGTYEFNECLKQAKSDYFERFTLVTISDSVNWFLFYDKLEGQYSVWSLDESAAAIEKNRRKYQSMNKLIGDSLRA